MKPIEAVARAIAAEHWRFVMFSSDDAANEQGSYVEARWKDFERPAKSAIAALADNISDEAVKDIDWLVAVLLEAGRTRAEVWVTDDGLISFKDLGRKTFAAAIRALGKE